MTHFVGWLPRPLRLLGLLAMAAGCPLAHEAPDPMHCFNDSDCFTVAGEYCYKPPGVKQTEGFCRIRDSGVPVPDRGPDSPRPDKGPEPDGGDLGPGPDGDLGPAVDGDLGPTIDGDVGPGPDSGGTNG